MASLSRSEAQSGRGRHGYTDPHKPHGTHTEIAPTHTRDPHTRKTGWSSDGELPQHLLSEQGDLIIPRPSNPVIMVASRVPESTLDASRQTRLARFRYVTPPELPCIDAPSTVSFQLTSAIHRLRR